MASIATTFRNQMTTAGIPADAASTAGREQKNVQQQYHQASPTSVTVLSIHVNNHRDQQSVSSSVDNKSSRSRRRRKGKARGNQVEPVASSPHSRNHYNNCNKKKNSSINSYNNGNGCNNNESGQQQRSSSFRTPIVTWRGGSRGPRNNNNRYNNNNSGSSSSSKNHNRHNNKHRNHPSPRFNQNANNSVCPASTGYPTSKKQHDAPMKKRDLYFSLHVERVGIASHPFKSESAYKAGSEPKPQTEQEQKAVARVTLTNWENEFVLDSFVAIPVPVSDFYDTGIRPEDVQGKAASSSSPDDATATDETRKANTAAAASTETATEGSGSNSCSFAAVRAKVERILRGKILIGYELDEGLQSLGLNHPTTDRRDCSAYFSKKRSSASAGDDANPTSEAVSLLEELSQKELNRAFLSSKAKIARDSPSNNDVMFLPKDSSVSRLPVQICVTTMELYKKCRNEWETSLIAQARERDRQQQDYLLKISQQRQLEQQQAQRQAQQQQAQQQQAQRHFQQQQYREALTSVSLHCETVRTSLSGRTKTLARVTIVDGPSKNVLLDEFAQIPVPVTDFCETGITDKDVMIGNTSTGNENNMDAPDSSNNPMTLSVLRGHVEQLLRGRLLVGYKVEESLKALGMTHPWTQVRDIAFFPPFLHTKVVGGSTSVVTVRSLEELSKEFLFRHLRPLGDRARPLDLCQNTLGLYESFRDQWEQQPHSQQQDAFIRRNNQQQQQVHHPHHFQGRMVQPSPSTMMQSPHLRSNHYYGQQPLTTNYNAPMMMTPPPQQQQLQRQVLVREQQQPQQQYSDIQSQTNSNSSSWFPWGKQQPHHQNNIAGASQTLSSQAFQVLQEDSYEQGSSSPKNHFYPVSSQPSNSAFAERRSSYGSAYGGGSEFSGATSDIFTAESVVSSMRDEVSSVFSGDQASTNPSKFESSSLPSSWFRFGSKKTKDSTHDDTKSNCSAMVAVQETEVLTDDDMLPRPTTLFPPSQDSVDDATKPLEKTPNVEGEVDEDQDPSGSSTSPQMPRTWFGFRKSPVQKDRSRSPSSSFSVSTLEDLSIAAQPAGLADTATEASIEITLSIPSSGESDGTISSLVGKPATTSLSSRPSSSWFGFRRSSKSSNSKNDGLTMNCSGKGYIQTEMPYHPDVLPAPTERTAAMEDDWLQEIMSQSTRTTQDFEPWMNGTGEASSGEIAEKPSNTSRGQASWFGFKRSRAANSDKPSPAITSLDTTFKAEAPREDDAWSDAAATGGYWLPEEANSTPVPLAIEQNDNIFHTRARLSTESTIPSVTTDEASEEGSSHSEGYSKDLDFGAAQSFNFLKI